MVEQKITVTSSEAFTGMIVGDVITFYVRIPWWLRLLYRLRFMRRPPLPKYVVSSVTATTITMGKEPE